MAATLLETARTFFQRLNKEPLAQKTLAEREQKVQFILTDSDPFYVDVQKGQAEVREGYAAPESGSIPEVTRLESNAETLLKLLRGEMGYSDAMNPNQPGKNFIRFLDNWMYKKGAINWLGRLFRIGREQRLLR